MFSVARNRAPQTGIGIKGAIIRIGGHKAAVLAGNAGDQEKALELVHQSERVREAAGEETMGDCAYGDGRTRRAFVEEERVLTAKVPVSTNGACFPKREFAIDLERREARCPAGQTTREYHTAGEGGGGRYVFTAAPGQDRSLRGQCVRAGGAHGHDPSGKTLAATSPGSQPNRGGAEELAGAGGGEASHRPLGAVRDSQESVFSGGREPVCKW